ncbi:hypothetical protein SKAU_G00393400 [Synaphobranchus kaupii]|uniref:Uncharacterized protein n=1 Tax=Synaphobranchus kaupii TaxID=118154 RepID=A0A9Q1EC06_SYNKA|nr:hypothetical protein SKAU_G00393400 [Synaphobranchus kaupii]
MKEATVCVCALVQGVEVLKEVGVLESGFNEATLCGTGDRRLAPQTPPSCIGGKGGKQGARSKPGPSRSSCVVDRLCPSTRHYTPPLPPRGGCVNQPEPTASVSPSCTATRPSPTMWQSMIIRNRRGYRRVAEAIPQLCLGRYGDALSAAHHVPLAHSFAIVSSPPRKKKPNCGLAWLVGPRKSKRDHARAGRKACSSSPYSWLGLSGIKPSV